MSEGQERIPVYGAEQIWDIAAMVGSAVNPLAMAATLAAVMRTVVREEGADTQGVARHPCVVAVFDVLAGIMQHEHRAVGGIDVVDAWRVIREHREPRVAALREAEDAQAALLATADEEEEEVLDLMEMQD